MTTAPTESPPAVAEAAFAARAAAEHMGGTVRTVESHRDAARAAELFASVWSRSDGSLPAMPELILALAHAGNYVAIAERDGSVIGAALAFRAVDGEGGYLHSHLAGVHPSHNGEGVGYAVKLHQRAWALENGLMRVGWTFDPLVSRNCYFNVMKLGAEISEYVADFYGPLSDSLNGRDASDRCVVSWRVASRRVTAATSGGGLPAVDPERLASDGVPVVLVRRGEDGPPVRTGTLAGAELALLQVPRDVVALRRSDPATAEAWRGALRGVLTSAFDSGLALTSCTRDGWYLLSARSRDVSPGTRLTGR